MSSIFKDFKEKVIMKDIPSKDENELRDYFAANAMLAVTQETQEMRTDSFLDWIKNMLRVGLNMDFLQVKFVEVDNVYNNASNRAYKYADSMMKRRKEKVDDLPEKEETKKTNSATVKIAFVIIVFLMIAAYNLIDITITTS